jgi:broad specificity phosphatase PhoE
MDDLAWLCVVRHGQSTGNVANDTATAAGAEIIEIPERDADVPLSPLGREQAEAVGAWLARLDPDQRPGVALSSPYLRTVQTARIALAAAGSDAPALAVDERLRDRELGILDLLTAHGVLTRFPEEAARRTRLGKFYYRPPGGESWADVALRLRGVLGDLRREHPAGRVLLFGHEAIIFLLRYLIEGLGEAELMEIARGTVLANTSLTIWESVDGGLGLVGFNRADHLRREGTPPTKEPDVQTEPV